MKIIAKSKTVGTSMIKARVIADSVRGMHANDAVGILTYLSKGASLPVKKTIQSAIANAENNLKISSEFLYISEIRIDKGPIAKINARRFITLGKGGSASFYRKYCHITVVLEEKSSSDTVEVSKKSIKKKKLEVVESEVKMSEVIKKDDAKVSSSDSAKKVSKKEASK